MRYLKILFDVMLGRDDDLKKFRQTREELDEMNRKLKQYLDEQGL